MAKKNVRDPVRVASAAWAYNPSSVFGMRFQAMISRLDVGDFETRPAVNVLYWCELILA